MRWAVKASRQDVMVAAMLVPAAILLLLPFLPFPGDGATMMKIRFRAEGARAVHAFSLPETIGVCSEIRAAISDRDPATGAFTKVACRANVAGGR